MPTGENANYVSGTQGRPLPGPSTNPRRTAHAPQLKPTGLDWDKHTPACTTCGTKTGALNKDDQCSTCAPPPGTGPTPAPVGPLGDNIITSNGEPFIAAIPVTAMFVDDTYQRRLDHLRVRRMARDYQLALVGILEVSARQDHTYAILDGQHRWELVRLAAPDVTHVPARVHTGLTIPQEAKLYHQLNTTRTQLRPWDKWLARRAAGDILVLQIEASLATHNLITGVQVGNNVVRATKACETVVELGGVALLDATIALIRSCYPSDQNGLDAKLITGVGNVLHYYQDTIDVDRLAGVLAGFMPRQIVARAAAVRELHTGTLDRLTAHVIVERYNQSTGPKIAPFFDRVRPQSKAVTVKVQAAQTETQRVRKWAISTGLITPNRQGRLPATVVAAYRQAHGDTTSHGNPTERYREPRTRPLDGPPRETGPIRRAATHGPTPELHPERQSNRPGPRCHRGRATHRRPDDSPQLRRRVRLPHPRPDKRKHPTEAAAYAVVTMMWGRAGRQRMTVYRCGDHWHVANKLREPQVAK